MELINLKARIVLCGHDLWLQCRRTPTGALAHQRSDEACTGGGLHHIDYFSRLGESRRDVEMAGRRQDKYDVHVVKGIENALSALDLLFTGQYGKLLLQVSEEPDFSCASRRHLGGRLIAAPPTNRVRPLRQGTAGDLQCA